MVWMWGRGGVHVQCLLCGCGMGLVHCVWCGSGAGVHVHCVWCGCGAGLEYMCTLMWCCGAGLEYIIYIHIVFAVQARHIQTKEVVAIKKMSYHGKGSQDVSWGKRGPPFLSEVSLLSVAGLRENDPQAVNKCPASSCGNDKMVLSFFKTFSPLQLPSFTYTHAHTNINTHTHTHSLNYFPP